MSNPQSSQILSQRAEPILDCAHPKLFRITRLRSARMAQNCKGLGTKLPWDVTL